MTIAETEWNPLVVYGSAGNTTRELDVRVWREPSEPLLALRYVLRAPLSGVRVPVEQPSAGRADGLWKHTCFEAFIAVPNATGYYELNFAPSLQWAIYRFNGYREGMSSVDVMRPPSVTARRFDDRLELEAIIGLTDLTALAGARTLKLALSAVVEDDSGTLSYWALKHAPGKPDFHHPHGFVLELSL